MQDLCVYGSKMYAIGSTSSKIEVLDLSGKLLKSIPMKTTDDQPMELDVQSEQKDSYLLQLMMELFQN